MLLLSEETEQRDTGRGRGGQPMPLLGRAGPLEVMRGMKWSCLGQLGAVLGLSHLVPGGAVPTGSAQMRLLPPTVPVNLINI
jgi:hypothetical protein